MSAIWRPIIDWIISLALRRLAGELTRYLNKVPMKELTKVLEMWGEAYEKTKDALSEKGPEGGEVTLEEAKAVRESVEKAVIATNTLIQAKR